MRLSHSRAALLGSTIYFVNAFADPALGQDMLKPRAPEPTAAPLLKHARDRLFARQTQDVQTCGFLDGDADNALYCGAGYGCAYFTTNVGPQWFECCATLSTGGIDFNPTTCFANSACEPYASHTYSYSYSTSLSGTEYCGSGAPYCGVTFLDASKSLSGSYTHFNCETASGLTSTAYDVAGAAVTSSLHSSSLPPSTAVTSFSSPPVTSPTSGSSSTATTSQTSTSATTSPTQTSEPSKTNVGAIAGGVVGGVAGLAIIGGIIGWLVYKKRKERQDADVPEVSVLPSK